MKKLLSIILFLSLTLGMHAQTENPKDDIELQNKFGKEISNFYFTGDYWQLEKFCDEKADSICGSLLTWGSGMAAAKLLQLEEAKKQLGKFVYEYRDELPASWMIYAADQLVFCLERLQEYDEAAKVADTTLQYISDEGIADKHQGAIMRFTDNRDRNLEFAKYPKMTLSRNGSDIQIPFRIKTLKQRREKNIFMTVDGSIQGKPSNMLFDTGFSVNGISRKLAEELHLKTIDSEVIMDAADIAYTTFVMADSMQIGNATLRNIKFILLDTDYDLVSDISQVVIGEPIMQLMGQFTMDFKKKVITSPFQLTDFQNKNLSFDMSGNIFVRIQHEGKPIDMMIDTGNGSDTHLNYNFYENNKEEVDKCKVDGVEVHGVVGQFSIEQACVKKFKFTLNDKQYRFPLVTVQKSDVDAALGENNIGLPFLSSFKRVTISLKDAHIEFE